MGHKHDIRGSLTGDQVVAGTLAAASVNSGGKLMSKAAKHPILVFGLGVVAGYFLCKYRKEIISSATKTMDTGKDFILQQKESLEDIVSEVKETD